MHEGIDGRLFQLSELGGMWHGSRISMDGASTEDFTEEDVDKILYEGHEGDTWDGRDVVVFLLKDDRVIAYESYYGPTGDGFCEDAYGGDADVIFAHSVESVMKEITDSGRQLIGYDRD